MGFKLPEGPLQNGRTYIYVRIWSGFPKSMDIAAFADVDNDQINCVLGNVAAMWMRESPIALVFPEEEARAKRVAAPPTEVLQALTPQTIEEIGMAWFTALLYKRPIAAPQWVLLHAEGTLEHALALVESLREDAPLGCPFEFKLFGRHELALKQAVLVERDLNEWDARSVPFELIAKPFHWKYHPLRRLRDNALQFSPIVAKMLEAESRPPIAAPAPTPTTIAPEIADAAIQPPEVEQATPVRSGKMSAREIADMCAVDPEALRKRLERWRRANLSGDWIETSDSKRGEPRFLYDLPSVQPVVDELKASIQTSVKRPSSADAPR